ncbi:MAG: hypothetical protein M1376_03500 [Planctomycetes bacterium]|nr:hypothetical protein [Planctomycetota bacterium]
MNTSKGIPLLGLVVLGSVALLSCAKKVPEEPRSGILTIEPLVGVGPVRFGASKEEIVRSFGLPDHEASETDLNYVASKGLAFEMRPQGGLQKIKCWSTDSSRKLPFAVTTFSGTTKEGIGMGATRERIVAAYGPPDKTDAKGDVENLYYDTLKAKFTLRQGALASIVLDAPE